MQVKWTAELIAAVLARQVFQRELICPNCTWTGHEADLLIVHPSLRLVDVEIKLTRPDLRADIEKTKWWHRPWGSYGQPRPPAVRLDWPPKVWKHYYVMPAEIWQMDLFEAIAVNSGVLIITELKPWSSRQVEPVFGVKTVRRAKPNRQAETIGAVDAVNIARLASIRYWRVLAGKSTRWSKGDSDATQERKLEKGDSAEHS